MFQVYSKAVRKGFEFSLMVVGASGLGKSTLVNSMFLTDIYSEGAKEPAKVELDQGDSDTQTLRVEAHHRYTGFLEYCRADRGWTESEVCPLQI